MAAYIVAEGIRIERLYAVEAESIEEAERRVQAGDISMFREVEADDRYYETRTRDAYIEAWGFDPLCDTDQ